MSNEKRTYEVYIQSKWVKVSITDKLLVSASELLDRLIVTDRCIKTILSQFNGTTEGLKLTLEALLQHNEKVISKIK